MRAITILMAIGFTTAIGCGGSSNPGRTIQFTASGEKLVLGGYNFPPLDPKDGVFVDGWAVTFEALLVTFDNITLSENPDKLPTDQSQTDQAVARVRGPWAVDLHKGGPLPGKGGSGEQAVRIATVENQNLNGNKRFDETKRYAFGFDIVPATNSANRINIEANNADYALMVQNGWTVLYKGTATFRGANCRTTGSYPFNALPQTVKFTFGFKSPATYINCQNPDNDPAAPITRDEEHQRGVPIKTNEATIAQATVHTDHPFWESFVHDTPAHFDQLAAQARDVGGGTFMVTLDNVVGLNYTSFRDRNGVPLPWRSCLPPTAYAFPDTSTVMHFDSLGVPYNPSGDPSRFMRDYYDYMTYNQSTQGHLNADGLCFTQRNYPSPP